MSGELRRADPARHRRITSGSLVGLPFGPLAMARGWWRWLWEHAVLDGTARDAGAGRDRAARRLRAAARPTRTAHAPGHRPSFTARSVRTDAPVVATYNWQVDDANNDVLTCRVDVDSDGTVDHEVVPCRSSSSVLEQFDAAGTRTATLEVTDGTSDPVVATTSIVVGAGPSEPYDITLRLDPGMRPEFRAAFTDAAARWESVLVAGVSDVRLDLPAGLLAKSSASTTVWSTTS